MSTSPPFTQAGDKARGLDAVGANAAKPPWDSSEPGFREILHELRCIARRARARLVWVLLASLVLAGLMAMLDSQRPPHFTSTIVLDVKDDSADTSGNPLTARGLAEHLRTIALSRTALLRIMAELDLYKATRERAPNLAIEEMRDSTDIIVMHDSFRRVDRTTSRSTHIAVSYSDPDPDDALDIVRALGDTIARVETDTRRAISREAVHAMAGPEAELATELAEAERLAGALRQELSRLAGAERLNAELDLRRMTSRIEVLGNQLRAVQAEQALLTLRRDAEEEAAGLSFKLLDPGTMAPPPRFSGRERQAIVFGFAFLVLLPVTGMLIGLFDSRVRHVDDLRRLGINALGHIPSFRGHNVGSLQARMSAKKSSRC